MYGTQCKHLIESGYANGIGDICINGKTVITAARNWIAETDCYYLD